MIHVVFVAPFFLGTTLRFVSAAADLPGVNLSLISQDPAAKLPSHLKARLAAHWRIDDGTDAQQILDATRALSRQLGKPARIIGALEQLQVPLAEVREALGLEGLSVVAAHNFRDKSRMKSVLAAAGLPCARHCLATDAVQGRAFLAEVGFPVVVKPPAGAGAARTFRLNNGADLDTYLQRYPPSVQQPAMFEEFMTGTEYSFDSVMIHGRPSWYSISRYLPSPLEVMETPWIQWCVLLPREVDTPEFADVPDTAFRGLRALGMDTGLSHMEWFRRPDGTMAISEVGARPPGAQFTTLLSYAHDCDFYKAWPRLLVFDDFPPPPRVYAAGAAYVRGQGRGRVRAIHGLAQAQKELGHVVVEARLPSAGQPPSGGYEGDGYIIVRHPQTRVVERALQRAVELVRIELA